MTFVRTSIRIAAVFLLPVLLQACRESKASPAPPPPPSVRVIAIQPERVSLTSEWIATLDGYYLEVLDADTRLFDAELGLAQAELAERSGFVEIYRALGGGWN
jgi:hypothetical protein